MTLQFFIKLTSGKSFVVRMEDTCTVKDLKCLIVDREGYLAESFGLRYSGKIMKNENTLSESGVSDDSTIYVW